jgi:lactose/cellobiose-specific phosphotransferase system IIC component
MSNSISIILGRAIKKAEQLPGIQAIRGGLVSIIPVLMIGSLALILKSLPVAAYQAFLKTGPGGVLNGVFTTIYNVTFGFLSIYMAICVSFFMEKNLGRRNSLGYGAVLVSVCSFLMATGFLTDSFEMDCLNASGMFVAILCSTLLSRAYLQLAERMGSGHIFSDGSDPFFSKVVFSILPVLIVLGLFALFNNLVCLVFQTANLWQLTNEFFRKLFVYAGEDFWGGLLYVLLSTFLWFFGIHGSDVLESANTGIFIPAAGANAAAVEAGMPATHLYTKTFFDVFVLMGGCGTLLCLLLALLLFSRRRSNRSLAKLAAFPMLFNINEIMVFGLPIIYNPVFFVPFLGTPLAAYLLAVAAAKLGLVPLTTGLVEWTTPIIIGGYEATGGSLAGVILQLVILAVGTALYAPFVKQYDCEKDRQARESLQDLVEIYQSYEAASREVCLTELDGVPGEVAKQLAGDLQKALAKQELYFLYQPQYNYAGKLFGAEALLRWKHPGLGLIYPPLIIKLAGEAGLLSSLERYIYLQVGREIQEVSDLVFSINATAVSLQDDSFVDFLVQTFPGALSGRAQICIEVTEQEAVAFNEAMSRRLAKLKANKFRLAVDDFSMGHTSLKYLQEGCFDEVKLDGSITKKVLTDGKVRDIISSVVFLSQAMKVTVVAEYVETSAQKEALAQLGCFNYQGYLYSPPVPLSKLRELV